MKIQLTIAIALLLAALGAAAQDQPSGQQRNQPRGRVMNPPKFATHNGHPALEYEGVQGWAGYIEFFMRQGEPALGFIMAQPQCPGHVYVTRTRVSGDFQGTSCGSFDVPRSGATVEKQEGKVTLTSGSATYTLIPMV